MYSSNDVLQPKGLVSTLVIFFFVWSSIASASPDNQGDMAWPKSIAFKQGKVHIYQPQPITMNHDRVTANAAFSVDMENADLVFGALQLTAKVTDFSESNRVELSHISLSNIRFPDAQDEELHAFQRALNDKLAGMAFTLDSAEFKAEIAYAQGDSTLTYNHQPPHIYFKQGPTVLVSIDGEPVFSDTELASVQRIINTPFFVVFEQNQQHYYLRGGHWWYRSRELTSGWQAIDYPPSDIERLAEDDYLLEGDNVDLSVAQLTTAPELIVSTEPAELINSFGDPVFAAIQGTSLLYMDNSESDVFLEIDSQQYFVLISGRWYRSGDLTSNQWVFVEPNELPETFASIPSDSEAASVLVNVAGTVEAENAIVDNAIPQTARVSRAKTDVSVEYSGEPRFELIENTQVAYAVNTVSTVLHINGLYYAVDNGIWFESAFATGPWEVSISVPTEVDTIPASSPVYPVRYVRIYDYTPSYVYFGYTPGYFGSYIYRGTVIFGTGYWYRPYYVNRYRYFPRPITWGFGAHYHPYSGWGYVTGLSYGWLNLAPAYVTYWGYAGYRYGYRHGYYHRNRHGYYRGHRNGYRYGFSAGRYSGDRVDAQSKGRGRQTSSNLYKKHKQGVRTTRMARHDVEQRVANSERAKRAARLRARGNAMQHNARLPSDSASHSANTAAVTADNREARREKRIRHEQHRRDMYQAKLEKNQGSRDDASDARLQKLSQHEQHQRDLYQRKREKNRGRSIETQDLPRNDLPSNERRRRENLDNPRELPARLPRELDQGFELDNRSQTTLRRSFQQSRAEYQDQTRQLRRAQSQQQGQQRGQQQNRARNQRSQTGPNPPRLRAGNQGGKSTRNGQQH